jgi:hypothetical protein
MEQGRNEPPREAGLLVPPGAPYIGSPGDMVGPMVHYTCTLLTVAMSRYGLWHVLSVLGVASLSFSCPWLLLT